jgi:hypothetical protein
MKKKKKKIMQKESKREAPDEKKSERPTKPKGVWRWDSEKLEWVRAHRPKKEKKPVELNKQSDKDVFVAMAMEEKEEKKEEPLKPQGKNLNEENEKIKEELEKANAEEKILDGKEDDPADRPNPREEKPVAEKKKKEISLNFDKKYLWYGGGALLAIGIVYGAWKMIKKVKAPTIISPPPPPPPSAEPDYYEMNIAAPGQTPNIIRIRK